MQFQLLGQLGVIAGAGIIDLGPPKQRAVLAVLLLRANEIVSTDRIIDLVWGGNPPRTAEHSIQIYISELRKALSNGSSSDLIETRPPGYVINVPPDSVDTLRFERLVREGISAVRSGDLSRGRTKLTAALEVWRGDPLAEFAYEDFAQGYIRSLTGLRSDAFEAMVSVELEQDRPVEARDFAAAAIGSDPLREEPRRIMMLALYRSGRQTEALRHFGEYQALLAEELGIEPSPAMRVLEEQILLQDPGLELHPIATSEGNPYRGLRSFTEDDADIYFGREALVEETLERLESGPGFASLVGPSGSGKSSAAQAGVIPVLRERGESVVVIQPGSRPLWELAGALDHAGFGARATLLRRLERDPETLVELITRPIVIIVDQFEELFTLAEPDASVRFGELLAAAVLDSGTPLKVIATLRADYYDKPLSLPRLASVFSDSVVSVKPMTAREIERAVVEPARKAGVVVEPALLAQLMADMGDEPGALPLLQFALFQLFERTSNGLSLADYQRIGGIHGALTAGANELIEQLGPDERALVEQLMMRMVQKGRSMNTSRPVPLRDLMELGVDNVGLQAVLEAFGARRLITFDRDATGAAVVEMAHEFLITEWPQMERWLDLHSEDLDRLYELGSASTDWLAADRSTDYLLRGERLERFATWATETSLRLTRNESEFLTASTSLRDRDQATLREQAEKEATLRQSARRRLWAFGSAVAAFAAAVTLLVITLMPEPAPDVILWSEPLEGSFGSMIEMGFGRALEEHGLIGRDFLDDDPRSVDLVDELVRRGTRLVILTSLLFGNPVVEEIIESNPETMFVWIDCQSDLPRAPRSNEACITSRHAEMGFLAGVVAAHNSEVGEVGLIVGADVPFMHPFQEGFEQGVAYSDDQVEVSTIYLSRHFDGFGSHTLGLMGAQFLMDEGVDVIFAAAGESGSGMFNAVYDYSESTGRWVWSIGVDVDEYEKLERLKDMPEMQNIPLEGWQRHILTSIVKRLDNAVFEAIDNFVTTGEAGPVEMTIANGGLDYVASPAVNDLAATIERLRGEMADGSVVIDLDGVDDTRHLVDVLGP